MSTSGSVGPANDQEGHTVIRLELKTVPQDGTDYETVAQLTVDDNGQVNIVDENNQLPLYLPALVKRDCELHRVWFDDDPVGWVQHVGSILRTGYLVPVVSGPATAAG